MYLDIMRLETPACYLYPLVGFSYQPNPNMYGGKND